MAKYGRQYGKSAISLGSSGHNPTDRGKMGTKRSVLVDEKGIGCIPNFV